MSESFTTLIHQEGVNPGLFTFWLSDLSLADSTKILPILLAVFTYYSQKMMMVDQQQKLLLIMSPIFILIFGLQLPAGVVLYWAVQTLLSTLQQHFLTGKGTADTGSNVIITKAKKVKPKRIS